VVKRERIHSWEGYRGGSTGEGGKKLLRGATGKKAKNHPRDPYISNRYIERRQDQKRVTRNVINLNILTKQKYEGWAPS